MSDQKIIYLANRKKSQNQKKFSKMLFLIILLAALLGVFLWNKFIEETANLDVQIPESKNISFASQAPIPMSTEHVAQLFESADDRPILLYIYTTWCGICSKNFPILNEIAREFQNTELQIITLAIDRNLEPQVLRDYLNQFGEVYFEPRFLAFKEGFAEFLQKKQIRYGGKIPYTVLFSRDGEIITKYVGSKSKKYLRNKIISELYPRN